MKVCKYGFNEKDQFVLHLKMIKPLLEILCEYFFRQVGDSNQVRTVITVRRLMVFEFIQVEMIQVVTFKKSIGQVICCLKP